MQTQICASMDRFDETIQSHAAEDRQHVKECRFSPYVNNGGTVVAVAGSDYAVCVADTRLSMGFQIHSRRFPQIYETRFFPYYAFNALVGVDSQGQGAIYDYDAIGSYQQSSYTARGTGSSLALSVLDNQIHRSNQTNPPPQLNKLQTIDLVKDIVTSVCERDIYTGDEVDVIVIDAAGINVSKMPLRND
ncbi:uncharacterized protein LOC129618219 [Condylostylus longicornis]|uniref:uncharacterized protein LOC129618219 n=1 Tax=Condylostylus longicornis TaxID=2530218 RepID=UPI00244E0AA8|nr:uncharacterized protein LOC129618219 [Condylostylus longicornis]